MPRPDTAELRLLARQKDLSEWAEFLEATADWVDAQPNLADVRAKLDAVDEARWTYPAGSIEEVMAYSALRVAVRRLFETEEDHD